MKVIDLLNMLSKGEKVPEKIHYNGETFAFTGYNSTSKNYINELEDLFEILDGSMLNDTVEILEEENEFHANNIEFNISYDKQDCIITLDENDFGIDKLHLDNCYFYKENDKWYVKKYDFKTVELEEKKIPEKLNMTYMKKIDDDAFITERFSQAEQKIVDTVNALIDYLNSKGE